MRNLVIIREFDQNVAAEALYNFENLHKNLILLGHYGQVIEYSKIDELHQKVDQFKHQIEDLMVRANKLTASFSQDVGSLQADQSLLELQQLKFNLQKLERDTLSSVDTQIDLWKQENDFRIEIIENEIFDDQPPKLHLFHDVFMSVHKIETEL